MMNHTGLRADRERTDTDKGLDDLLFGSGAVRGRRNPPPAPQPVTQPVKPTPPPSDKKRPEPVGGNSGSKVGGGNRDPVTTEQPNNNNSDGKRGYNRPSYIRKLKKIAENFDF